MKKRETDGEQIKGRRPQNIAEGKLYDLMKSTGWTVTKRGWPDFFCVNAAGEVCAVEVKPHSWNRLKREQLAVARALKAAGIAVYKWSPDGGFTDPEYVGERPRR